VFPFTEASNGLRERCCGAKDRGAIKMRRIAVLLSVIAVAIFSRPVFGQGYPQNDQGGYPPNYQGGYSNNQAGDPPSRVARLSYITGKVSFEPSGEEQWSQASMNYPVTTGDRLYTDDDGRAEFETGNIAVRMAPNTDLSTTNLNDQLVQLGLSQGTLRVRAYEIAGGNSIEIDTPSAALTLLRAGSYRVETYPDGNTTLVAVNDGDLEISAAGITRTLHAGEAVRLEGTDYVRMDRISLPDRDDFDQWCSDRDGRFMNSDSRQYVSSYTPGYADLDQYGRWDNAPEYGRVWYPSQVAADWAPYRYGRWVWVEPWGWTWVEQEPWGFAPFHYGRWALIGSRWGWVPGPVIAVRPIYAPALVAFAGGPRAGVQVWFPLGPRDPYLPWYHHSDGYLRQVNVTNVRYVNVTNITNIRVENIHYAYQRIAPTAVSTEVFRGSRPVGRERVRLDADDIGRARVINHPDVRPDERTIHAGLPAAHPPVESIRPRIENRVVNARVPEGGRPGEPRNDRDDRPDRDRNDERPGYNRNPVFNHQGEAGNPGGQSGQNNDRNANAGDRGINDHRGEAGNPGGQNREGDNRQNNDRNPRIGDNGRPPDAGNPRNLPGRDNPPSTGDNRNGRGPETTGGPYQTKPAIVQNGRGPDTAGGPYQTKPAIVQNGRGGETGASDNGRSASNGPPQDRHSLVNKNPAPPQNPSFSQRQPAMQDHPGRPLEPQQVENIRRGEPAGPRQDREVPPHQASAQRQGPPPARNDSRPEHERR
jgi:hypothetical protein